MAKMSEKQQERQQSHYRDENGKYAKVNPCYVCGKSAGVDYLSHKDTDVTIGDDLMVLCGSCYDKLGDLDGKEAVEVAFGKKETKNSIRAPGLKEASIYLFTLKGSNLLYGIKASHIGTAKKDIACSLDSPYFESEGIKLNIIWKMEHKPNRIENECPGCKRLQEIGHFLQCNVRICENCMEN